MRDHVARTGKNMVHPRKDLDITKVEYNNLQKLRFFGLIHHYEEKGKRVEGCWLITRLGGDFLNGEVAIPKRVKTFRNHIVERDSNKLFIHEVIESKEYLSYDKRLVFDFAVL